MRETRSIDTRETCITRRLGQSITFETNKYSISYNNSLVRCYRLLQMTTISEQMRTWVPWLLTSEDSAIEGRAPVAFESSLGSRRNTKSVEAIRLYQVSSFIVRCRDNRNFKYFCPRNSNINNSSSNNIGEKYLDCIWAMTAAIAHSSKLAFVAKMWRRCRKQELWLSESVWLMQKLCLRVNTV